MIYLIQGELIGNIQSKYTIAIEKLEFREKCVHNKSMLNIS